MINYKERSKIVVHDKNKWMGYINTRSVTVKNNFKGTNSYVKKLIVTGLIATAATQVYAHDTQAAEKGATDARM